jgi:hypothetical protein
MRDIIWVLIEKIITRNKKINLNLNLSQNQNLKKKSISIYRKIMKDIKGYVDVQDIIDKI